MSVVPMKSLLEAGVHFGHRTRRWNPKMKNYIFTERNGIHIIDLQQTITRLESAYDLIRDTVTSGGIVLFVGTKRQAQENIVTEASRCNMPYVEQRWLGGTLTNWRTIRQRIDYLIEAEKKQARGEFARLVKKEALMREREIARLNYRLGGLKEMRRLPNLLFVVDVRRDAIAVKEANILGIPVIAMVDTNCDPDPIDHVIPSNDDAIRAIKLIVGTMANAVIEGRTIQSSIREEEDEAEMISVEEAQERYLGPSTLAKIQETTSKSTEDLSAEEAEPPAGTAGASGEEPTDGSVDTIDPIEANITEEASSVDDDIAPADEVPADSETMEEAEVVEEAIEELQEAGTEAVEAQAEEAEAQSEKQS